MVKPKFLMMLAVIGMLAAFPAMAMDLHQARSTGVVGETLDGYIAAIKPSAEVNALVAEINAKRRQEYGRISAANNQPIGVVSSLAAQQIINGLPSGSYYKGPDGAWLRR